MFNFQAAMQMIQQIRNPQQFLQGMGIPNEVMKSPDDVAQYLLNNGKVTQQQIQQAKSIFGR